MREHLGGSHSAKLVMVSVDFYHTHKLQQEGKWQEAGEFLAKEASKLELAGADFILICTNTMHKVIDTIQKSVKIPIIHIAQAASEAILEASCKKAILLGTRFTMQEDFNKKIFEANQIAIVTPDAKDLVEIDRIIFEELIFGKILPSSKQTYLKIIEKLYIKDPSIDSLILGCTEIGLLIGEKDTHLKTFDTTVLHVQKALAHALKY